MTLETQRIRSTVSPSSKKHHSHHHTSKSSQSNNPSQADGFYGHEDTAKMAAAFITHLFSCPELPPPSTNVTASGQPAPSPKLANFVAYALHRTRLAPSVTYAALYLLQKLKTRFPAARGSSGHRLFISAFMIASKIVCDDTYSNKSWAVVGQAMFSLREINQMEREMCGYLDWQLNVGGPDLESFSDEITVQFASKALQATYFRTRPTKAIPGVPPYASTSSSTPVPGSLMSAVMAVAPATFAKANAAAAAAALSRPSSSMEVSGSNSSSQHPEAASYPSPTLAPHATLKPSSPLTVVSTHLDEEEEEEAEADGISPMGRSMASSSPESDMVSTPTSMHGGDDSTQILSHEPLIRTQHPHHHHAVPVANGGAATKGMPPAVKVDGQGRTSMSAREAVW